MVQTRFKSRIPEFRARTADTLVLAMVVVLPWSTSVATILAVCWMAALLLSPYFCEVGQEIKTWPGGTPAALWALAAIGMLWANVPWPDRLMALGDLNRLMAIPFLFAQFRVSPYGKVVLIGFLLSCTALLCLSFLMYFFPALSWRWERTPGVPVKDYIAQSGAFVLCAFGLIVLSLKKRAEGIHRAALALALLAAIFLINVGYIATGRTAIVAAIVLVFWLALKTANWRYALTTLLAGTALLGATYTTSPYLQGRLSAVVEEAKTYRPDQKAETSTAVRLEFWRRSLVSIAEAPWIGHGTGAIQQQFGKTSVGGTGLSAIVTNNPHNQTLATTLQLGVLGAILLWMMWLSHLWFFRGSDWLSLLGSVVVIQGIVGCLFNSHLADFTQGSLYVIGVGVIGGMLRRRELAEAKAKR